MALIATNCRKAYQRRLAGYGRANLSAPIFGQGRSRTSAGRQPVGIHHRRSLSHQERVATASAHSRRHQENCRRIGSKVRTGVVTP